MSVHLEYGKRGWEIVKTDTREVLYRSKNREEAIAELEKRKEDL